MSKELSPAIQAMLKKSNVATVDQMETGAGGVPRLVVAGIAVHLGRMVGVSRRDLPWI